MKKEDFNNIFENYTKSLVKEATPPMALNPNSFQPTVPTSSTPNANSFSAPTAMSNTQSTSTGGAPNLQNLTNQINSLDQKLNNMMKAIENITVLLAKLTAPTGRVAPTAPQTQPSNLGMKYTI